MRIVTRPDFDGVVCAALLSEVHPITRPTLWVEPNEMQRGEVPVCDQDIIANLPFHPDCGLWFDHHFTNKPLVPFRGAYELAPSAAGVIHRYYRDSFTRDYTELIHATDRIDSADLTLDEVMHPEKYDAILLSMTLTGRDAKDEAYWNRLVQLIRDTEDIRGLSADPEVAVRRRSVIDLNRSYRDVLIRHTRVEGAVAVTDFRPLGNDPRGNRFLVYALFPETTVSVRVRFDSRNPERVIIGIGHSIFNRQCRVNAGLLLAEYSGGGHRGAGSCTVPAREADACIAAIVAVLIRNLPNE